MVATTSVLVAACSGGTSSTAPSGAAGSPAASTGAGSSGSAAPAAAKVRLQLQWYPQAQFAGYFAAQEQGYYDAEGHRPRRSSTAARTIAPQTVGSAPDGPEFTIAWVPKVLQAREAAGSDLVDIAQIFQRSGTLSVSWKDSNITEPGRLQGQEDRRLGLRQRVRGHGGAKKAGLEPGDRLHQVHPGLRHDACCSRSRSTSPRR